MVNFVPLKNGVLFEPTRYFVYKVCKGVKGEIRSHMNLPKNTKLRSYQFENLLFGQNSNFFSGEKKCSMCTPSFMHGMSGYANRYC